VAACAALVCRRRCLLRRVQDAQRPRRPSCASSPMSPDAPLGRPASAFLCQPVGVGRSVPGAARPAPAQRAPTCLKRQRRHPVEPTAAPVQSLEMSVVFRGCEPLAGRGFPGRWGTRPGVRGGVCGTRRPPCTKRSASAVPAPGVTRPAPAQRAPTCPKRQRHHPVEPTAAPVQNLEMSVVFRECAASGGPRLPGQ
jgi:hypothetical protein